MPLTANFIADFSSFLTACTDATKSTDDLVESAGNIGRAVDESIAAAGESIKSVGASVADFGKAAWSVLKSDELANFAGDVKNLVTDFVNEFAEGEAAAMRLSVAVKGLGFPPEVAESYGEMATALQKVSTFSDEAITDTMTLFTTVGSIGPDQMGAAVRATMDLATVMGVDLPAAAKIMAKAASSNGEELGKLEVILADTLPEGADFTDVLKAMGTEMGGQFSAALKTTSGQMANMENQLSDVNEQIGEVFAENLKIVMDLFQSLPDGMQTTIIMLVSLGTAIAPLLVSGAALVSMLGGLGVTIGALALPFGVVVAAIAVFAAAWYFWDDIVALTKSAWQEIKTALEGYKKLFDAVVGYAKGFYEGIKTWLWDQLSGLVDGIIGLPGKITGAFKSMYDAVVGHSYVPDMISGIESEFGTLHGIMVVPTEQAVGACLDLFAGLETGFDSLMGRGFAPGGLALPEGTDMASLAASMVGRPQDLSGLSTPSVIKDAYESSSDLAPWRGDSPVNVTVNMSGMLSDDDPQTRSRVNDLVSGAVMQGMRNSRLMGTA